MKDLLLTELSDGKWNIVSADGMCRKENSSTVNMKYAQIIYDQCNDKGINECHASTILANLTGISDRQARKYMRVVSKGSEQIQDEVANSNLSINIATAIINTAPNNAEKQDRIMDAISDLSYEAAKAVIQALRSGEYDEGNVEEVNFAKKKVTQRQAERQQDKREVANNIRQAEESLTYLLNMDSKPDKMKMANLIALCIQLFKAY